MPIFQENSFFPKCVQNGQKSGFLKFFRKFYLYLFLDLLVLCMHKFNIWENSGSSLKSQKLVSQSDCKILKSAIFQEKIDEST